MEIIMLFTGPVIFYIVYNARFDNVHIYNVNLP